jgi:malate/lactate dehydrogenase
MKKNFTIFRSLGHAIHNVASKDVRVILVGNPACTNCHVCAQYAKIPKNQFFALSRLDCNRAVGQIALQAKCSVADVTNVMVWGSHSEVAHVDIDHAQIRVETFNKPVRDVIKDKDWVKGKLATVVANRGQEIMARKKASSSIAAARAIVDHVHDLFCGTAEGEFVPMCVFNDSHVYDIPAGIWFSVPVKCQPHDLRRPSREQYTIYADLKLSTLTQSKIRQAGEELLRDKEYMEGLISQSEGPGTSRV